MADLDYVKVIGRFAVAVGDSGDEDLYPDIVYCDQGTVSFVPNLKSLKVESVDGTITIGSAPITCSIDSQGYLTYGNNPFVWLLDLGSEKVNPRIERDKAAYMVTFKDVKAQGMSVALPSFAMHPLPGVDNDITKMSPLPQPGTGKAIIQGPPGQSGVIVLGPTDVVPDGTADGTVVLRTVE